MDAFETVSPILVKSSEIVQNGLEMVNLYVNKNYLIEIDKCEPEVLDDSKQSFSFITLYKIGKIAHDCDENINDKLISVYSALSNFGSTVLLLLRGDSSGVQFYLGTRDNKNPAVAGDILKNSLRGNFPGIEIEEQTPKHTERLLDGFFPDEYSALTVSSVSVVPGVRDEDKENFVQGIEKFIDSMSGETYTAIFIAAPLSKADLENKKRGFEELYTSVSPFSKIDTSYGENNSLSVATGMSDNLSKSINKGISDTTGATAGSSEGYSDTKSKGHANSWFWGMSSNAGTSRGSTYGSTSGTSTGHTDNYSEAETTGTTSSRTDTDSKGTTATISMSRQNKTVEELLKKIDEQLGRIRSCESYGLWNCACYFVSEKAETCIVAANTFKALVAGENTGVENSFINVWNGGDYAISERTVNIIKCLRYGIHPRFSYLPARIGYTEQIVSPASMISGLELPLLMGFPHRSVNGVISITVASFGRNILTRGKAKSYRNINLGAVYHMGETFRDNRIKLDLESMTAHCFITGSTGSGKSNTTYKILDELTEKNNVNFLVVEPAKGEYKYAFGALPGVNIFTTNPKYCNMFRINPFVFNDEIHVLEHLDRLIEIFSACWPLYAAMPAILKASFERAYISHGWDLNQSIHINRKNGKYPNFNDIVRILPAILNESEFSAETKGNYVGSLVTRVESLTNGLLGQIFTGTSIDDEVLFDQNTIVDLSRIGSTETKALLMGVLVLKLSEYRQSTSIGTNLPLKHITVLEEAHNLLKRTSTDQGQESANVQGKSVEMISNSIAEMRTYGEGFIIVDQSPTAVDISAIKNTNTKIIMRLPEANDCEAVGKSIGLNDAQIKELSRLDRGVAVIYQNNWLEAILGTVDKFGGLYEISSVPTCDRNETIKLIGALLQEINDQGWDRLNMTWINTILNKGRIPDSEKTNIRNIFIDYQKKCAENNKTYALAELVYKLTNCNDLFRIYEDLLPPAIARKSDINAEIVKICERWNREISRNLENYAEFADKETKEMTLKYLLFYKIEGDSNKNRYMVVWYVLEGDSLNF